MDDARQKPLTVTEAAKKAGVTEQAIYNALHRHRQTKGRRGLQATQHGRAYVIQPADFDAWLVASAPWRECAQMGMAAAGAPDHEVAP